MMNLLAYSDGTRDLIEIANIIDNPVFELIDTVAKLKKHELLVSADAH
jgi:aminopeptidase-like protein